MSASNFYVCNDSIILSTLVGRRFSKNHSHSQTLNVLSIYLQYLGSFRAKCTEIHHTLGVWDCKNWAWFNDGRSKFVVRRLQPSSCFGCFLSPKSSCCRAVFDFELLEFV